MQEGGTGGTVTPRPTANSETRPRLLKCRSDFDKDLRDALLRRRQELSLLEGNPRPRTAEHSLPLLPADGKDSMYKAAVVHLRKPSWGSTEAHLMVKKENVKSPSSKSLNAVKGRSGQQTKQRAF